MNRMMAMLICSVFLLTTSLWAITIEDIIRLSQAKVGNEVLINVIKASEERPAITTENILQLKKAQVNEEVIIAWVKQVKKDRKQQQLAERPPQPEYREEWRARKEHREEMSPFDQFFLSTYYSRDYGWPEKNYDSPADILSQGLYYQPPHRYPYSRKYRVYGHTYSPVPGAPGTYTFSPYSVLVPRHPKGGHSRGYHRFHRHHKPYPHKHKHQQHDHK